MNQTAWDMLGQPGNWRSKPLGQFAPELDHHLQHWLHKISPRIASFDIRHQNTTEMRVRFSQLGTHSRRATMINLEDTTEQREKLQSAKLASLGQLTASIAHEINNPIAVIQGNLDLMRETLGPHAAPVQAEIQLLNEQVERMRLIVTQLLQFAQFLHAFPVTGEGIDERV